MKKTPRYKTGLYTLMKCYFRLFKNKFQLRCDIILETAEKCGCISRRASRNKGEQLPEAVATVGQSRYRRRTGPQHKNIHNPKRVVTDERR